MDSKSIFAAIEESGQKLNDAISQMTKKGFSALKNAAGDAQWNKYVEELGYDAQECKQILGGTGFPRMQRFLTAYKAAQERELRDCTLADKTKQAIACAARLELLDTLMARPERLIKEFEKVKK